MVDNFPPFCNHLQIGEYNGSASSGISSSVKLHELSLIRSAIVFYQPCRMCAFFSEECVSGCEPLMMG